MKPLESRMTEDQLEDHRLEIENRLRNLFWTITGDYAAEFQPDVETYRNAPELALYLAIRQGALAKYLDVEQLTAYAMKKCAEGAEESALMELIQFCADVAVYPLLCAERKKSVKKCASRAPYFLPALGLLAPYLERACIRPLTPWVSRLPRMMW